MNQFPKFFLFIFYLLTGSFAMATDGYNLWMNYREIEDSRLKDSYIENIGNIYLPLTDKTSEIAREEMGFALNSLLNIDVEFEDEFSDNSLLLIAEIESLPRHVANQIQISNPSKLGEEGYLIKTVRYRKKELTVISGNSSIGILYGVFHFLRLIQSHKDISNLNIEESPKVKVRLLNHWDNLDRTVERGYAGSSIWNWHKLPEYIDKRYIDYARANASIGINGTVLTNVNANALVLTDHYLEKVEALANVFRPYGIKVYLTARFSAPMEIGGLETADPMHEDVIKWWSNKAGEIYQRIPDFGGFLVKANSEGQPGPQNFGRNHADGANMLARAVAPHGGIVMWRAFVYSEHDATDRAKQAYSEFVPYDGKFENNVLIQVKNGPIDFQPREPFHPMFGAMPSTPLMMEFQITQEYLGFSTHLVFLPKLFEEVLQSDTYQKGENSTVSKVIDGSLHSNKLTGMAGVANIGSDINWTGHPFGQANWYGYGRLAWNPHLTSKEIAEEWLRLTFSNNNKFIAQMTDLLINSRETVVNYMTPLGLHHIMDAGHHYGPGPWISNMPRPDWTSVYYHKADSLGIGFNRTNTGSEATSQYANKLAELFNDPKSCPEEYLLWFHHLPWDYKMKSGMTLWDQICLTYQKGVDEVGIMVNTWQNQKEFINDQQFKEVEMLLKIQQKEAKWWRDACLLYFQQFSGMPFPEDMEKPENTLKYYQNLKFPYAPGIRPRW